MSKGDLPDPDKKITRWTSKQRGRSYLSRKNTSQKGIDLTTGGPQWKPFKPAIEDAKEILDREEILNRYYPTGGTFSDQSYSDYMETLGISQPDGELLESGKHLLPGDGATQLYAAAAQSLFTKNDVLLVPVPTYGFFLEPENLKNPKVKTMLLRAEDNYRLTPEHLDSEIERINRELAQDHPPRKITAFLHINPHNPTGAVNNKEEVEKLAAVIKKHNVRLVIDDLAYLGCEYGHADPTYTPQKFQSRIAYPMAAVPGMFDKTVTITSLSKAYNLVGLRAGLAAGPEAFIKKMRKNIGRNSEFINNVAQVAIDAVCDPKNRKEKKEYLAHRAEYLAKAQYALRVLVNGWDNDAEARHYFKDSKDEFIRQKTFYYPIEKDEKYDNAGIEKDIEAVNKRKQQILDSDIIEEARPYFLDDIDRDIRFLRQHWRQDKEWFKYAKKNQETLKPLMETGIPGIKTVNSLESGFFMLLDATALKGQYYGKEQINDAADFTRTLSQHMGVYLVPGTAMGYHGDRLLLRLSFPKSVDGDVLEGLTRLKKFTEALKDHPGPIPPQEHSKKIRTR